MPDFAYPKAPAHPDCSCRIGSHVYGSRETKVIANGPQSYAMAGAFAQTAIFRLSTGECDSGLG